MGTHKGKILKEELEKFMNLSGSSLTTIARKAGYDQSSPYRHFEKPDLSIQIIMKYARAIDYDLSESFPELLEYVYFLEKKSINPPNDTLNQKEIELWKNKYIELLERYNILLEARIKN